jgi:drug/metabolite transporter (DMT)-like permease
MECMTTSTSSRSRISRGYTIALVSAAILSTTAILIRHLTLAYQLPALVLAFWRDTFVTLTLALTLAVLGPKLLRVERKHLPFFLGFGAILAIFNIMWTLSVQLNGAAIATVLGYCSAGFTALLGWWLLKERLGWAMLLAVALSLAGCALVSGILDPSARQTNLMGILTGTLSGLCYAVYTLLGRTASKQGINPWTVLLYTFGTAAVILLCLNLLPFKIFPGTAVEPSELFWLKDSLPGWGALVLLAAGPTMIGFGLYNVSLGYLPSSVANLLLTSEPVFTAIIAYFLFGEVFNGVQIGGSLMILAGVILLRVYEGRQTVSIEQPAAIPETRASVKD